MTKSGLKPGSASRLLFVSTNGVGMGHLSRLLAVARRLPGSAEAIFLTMSQALHVIRQFGFHAEFLPFYQQTLSNLERWNAWLEKTLDQVLSAYAIETVVFDGNVVYPGILNALAPRDNCLLVWIRRGMWRADQENTRSLLSGKDVDLIIEPDDVASEFDSGASVEHRKDVVVVDPIRLLDPAEVLSRSESCRMLGLDPDEHYVLIQLGAGNNHNFIDLIGSTVQILEGSRLARPVIAEWVTAEFGLDLWPHVPRMKCFPISRYIRAFDFTLSGVGYNTFNDIVSFGIPSVLVPNLNRTMDDQRARAAYADHHGAAVHLNREMLPHLDQVLVSMLDEDKRQAMTENCLRIAKPNGARRVAQLVSSGVQKSIGTDG